MRATELMIGDLIQYNGEILRLYEFSRKYGYFGDGHPLNGILISEIEPIPLTQEILEKNLKEFILGLNCMYELGGPYCISLEQENCWVFGLATKAARYPMVKIRYVHELQHALKLCGIDLEIKL